MGEHEASMTSHTPTPWELEPGAWISGKHAHRNAIVADCTHDGAVPEASQNANAAFIVKAVNSHDALVKALEIFLGHDERFQVQVGGNPIAVEKMLSSAREALAKAATS